MKVDIPVGAIAKKIQGRLDKAQVLLDSKIAYDSNLFCPMDTGALQASVYPVEGNGRIAWNTPYARAQYYALPNKSKDSNPRASTKWFEQAKAQYQKEWERLANESYNR